MTKENEYFPKEKIENIKKSFDIFDRNQDQHISWEEAKEIMIALNYMVNEEE